MFTLLTNARVFSPEDLGLCSLLIHADRIVAVEKIFPCLMVSTRSSIVMANGLSQA